MKALVLDDDPFVLKLLELQLRRAGCREMRLCEHAGRALDVLQDEGVDSFDIVFCDLQMPDVDGVEFVRHLAARGYRGALVLVSGESTKVLETVRRLADAQGVRVVASLAKPVSAEDIALSLAAAAHITQPAVADDAGPLAPAELRQALDRDELFNCYQPQVDLLHRRMVGVETLVRWNHPTRGVVGPDRFIGLAEQTGLIDALTDGVLQRALAQANAWRRHGLDLTVSVNVSMESLAALDFPDRVQQLLQSAGVEASRLVLEITESRLLRDPRATLDILSRLRLKRIGLSIDDFGTGHSSLSQLRDLPFDELKVDRSFVQDAVRDPSSRAIVEATLAMTRSLDIKSVAEGIETEEQHALLARLGCRYGQGYLYAQPMTGVALAAWARLRDAGHEAARSHGGKT